jgi:hypothetical protein
MAEKEIPVAALAVARKAVKENPVTWRSLLRRSVLVPACCCSSASSEDDKETWDDRNKGCCEHRGERTAVVAREGVILVFIILEGDIDTIKACEGVAKSTRGAKSPRRKTRLNISMVLIYCWIEKMGMDWKTALLLLSVQFLVVMCVPMIENEFEFGVMKTAGRRWW